jgi:tetratricopeptide (TPR) repeat protein
MRKSVIIFLCIAVNVMLSANRDSLLKVVSTHKIDSVYIAMLTDIAATYEDAGDYDMSISYCLRAKKIADSLHNNFGLQSALNSLGNCYLDKGDVKKALESHLAALKIRELIHSKLGIAYSYLNLGNIHFRLGDEDKALLDYKRSIDLMYEMGDTLRAAICLTNMGSIYSNRGDITKAQEHYLKALSIRKRAGDMDGVAEIYSNLSVTLMDAHKYKEALEFAFETIKLYGETGSKMGKSISYSNIGDIYEHMGDLNNAIKYQIISLDLAKEMESSWMLQTNYHLLALAYEKKNDFAKAVLYAELFSRTRDSQMSSENGKMIAEMQTRFETGKKEKEIQLLQSDKSIRDLQLSKQEANINRQRIIIYTVIGGLLVMVFLIGFIWRGYRQKKKIQMGLERKNIEINLQKNEIEEKSKLITDSIDYAKNIQTAILPPDDKIKTHFPESFILFEPKEIVSGDFYWLHESRQETAAGGRKENDCILFATVDCAGEGVPAAFMSIMAYNMLENISIEKKLSDPSLILEELNKVVSDTAKNKNTSIKFEMNISLIAFNPKKNELQFAGTKTPLVIIRNSKINKLIHEANKTQAITLEKGDMIYLFTDGVKGDDAFMELLISISQKNMQDQKQIFQQSNNNKTDDVLVVGIRV